MRRSGVRLLSPAPTFSKPYGLDRAISFGSHRWSRYACWQRAAPLCILIATALRIVVLAFCLVVPSFSRSSNSRLTRFAIRLLRCIGSLVGFRLIARLVH
jgi:hypothetical protein